jgi:signal peptidase I
MNLKKLAKKTWKFLVHDDSWQSFIADAILILIIGKFILFPGLGMVFGTAYPLVAVVSGSMDHNGQEFGDWWADNKEVYESTEINENIFTDFSFKNGFEKGDVMLIKGTDFDELNVGDVIVFSVSSRRDPIIHRIISIGDGFVSTKGDANFGQISFEKEIHPNQVQGKAILSVPYIGWVKVGAMEFLGML